MRRTILILSLLFLTSASAHGYQLGLGGYTVAQTTYGIISISDSNDIGNLSWDATINGNLSGKDISLESIVVDSVDYEDGGTGIHYGALHGYDLGYGLLVNELDTEMFQPAFKRNDQKALVMDHDGGDYVIEGFGTYGHLYGGQISEIYILGMKMGFEFVSDASLASDEALGRSATGAYVELPLTDEISLFGEAATTSGGGEGSLAGISLGYDIIISNLNVNIAAASFNDRFIPGYFTAGYDIDPVQLSSLESGTRRYGTIVSIDTSILYLLGLHLSSENYTDGGTANSGRVSISPVTGLSLSAYVKELSFLNYRPIKGEDSNLIGANLEYAFTNGIIMSINYKKTPLGEDGRPYETSLYQLAYKF